MTPMMKENEIPEATDIPITASLLREWLDTDEPDGSSEVVEEGDDAEWLLLVTEGIGVKVLVIVVSVCLVVVVGWEVVVDQNPIVACAVGEEFTGVTVAVIV